MGRVLAERVGFEPTIGYSPIHAFQACAFNRSAISPLGVANYIDACRGQKKARGATAGLRTVNRADQRASESTVSPSTIMVAHVLHKFLCLLVRLRR